MSENDQDDRRSRDDRRQDDRRQPRESFAGQDRRGEDDRRSGERRSKDELRADYEGAVSRAKAALLAHGMDSPQFAEAARATEDISSQLKAGDWSGASDASEGPGQA